VQKIQNSVASLMKELRKILFEISRVPNFWGYPKIGGSLQKCIFFELLIINGLAGIQKVCQGG
jgi:hypothetical protein